MTKQELDYIFKSSKDEKTGWYTLNEKREKNWDKEKVKEFWLLIRKYKMDKKDYDFKRFHFPDGGYRVGIRGEIIYLDTFFKSDDNKIFEDHVDFYFARFSGSIYFNDMTFNKNATFTFVIFLEGASFNKSIFNGNAYFLDTGLHGSKFIETIFNGITLFKDAMFDGTGFLSTEFNGKTTFQCDLDVIVQFYEVFFNDNVQFILTNMEEISFKYCNKISEIKFNNCNWNIKNRLILRNEHENLEDSENNYRQLKTNFYNIKDWELSNYCYASEMEMRKLRLHQNKKHATWFIYIIYDFLSDYTTSFLKPMAYFLILSFLIFPLFYSDWCFFQSSCNWSSLPIKISIENSLPFFKSDNSNKLWGIKYFQTFISTVLLALILLGLKKRFKQ